MAALMKEPAIRPRIIIHGGAGNITRENLPPAAYHEYREALLGILQDANSRLVLPGATALDVATFAVELLENNALFNSGHGAVYTRAGTHELEASVMVSRGYKKRGVGVMRLTRVKNPIQLAREMLRRGEEKDGGGAHQHCQIAGETCNQLAEKWGLDMVEPSYFWTRRRWDEHRRGLGKEHDDETYKRHRKEIDAGRESSNVSDHDSVVGDPSWNGHDYLPQGTVGCVVMDSTGTLCTATSTGGITNKVVGRIGDTPTLGAGFWAEEWTSTKAMPYLNTTLPSPMSSLSNLLSDCLPSMSGYLPVPLSASIVSSRRGAAMSGTGNGDSFLRVNAVRTAAAMARFSSSECSTVSLQKAVTAVAGPNGVLQQSAEDRWHQTGEGEGGIIGVELANGQGQIVADFNCGGMFRTWMDDKGKAQMMIFREEYRE
ncbi:Hypothetical protein R9X50_00532500 [Acrodontium crateriforme]|uniref:N-terminal nucleophile aminohydrolase n=1 Tax=Acrodontium crateriforme TaxID=150365 RepID=A0AAQ3RAS6_9PEZI|nr:Hypothetical protein R9X50_00532500 [Acrodontium crateriforme]